MLFEKQIDIITSAILVAMMMVSVKKRVQPRGPGKNARPIFLPKRGKKK